MPDLGTQLREYLEATAPPVELDDVLSEPVGTGAVRPLQPRRFIRPLHGWMYAAAAAAVMLLLAGGAALLFRVSDTPVATTPPTDPSSLSAWSRVPNDEAVFGAESGQGMLSVTAGGPGLVAVGWDDAEGIDHRAPVWTSADGLTWSRIPHDPAVFGGEPIAVLWGVTAGGPGLVAVGSAEDHVTAVWTSGDGITWSRVPHDDAVFPGGWIKSVTVGGPGLVAVGSLEDDVATVWTSPDGITWSRVPHDPAVFGGEGNQLSINDVTAGGPGLVAVGDEQMGGGRVFAAVWTSPDGITWSRVPYDEEAFGATGVQWMSSVIAGPSGLVAVGAEASKGAAAVWTSPDGITWSRVPHDDEVFGRATSGEMSSVTYGGPGLVAVGSMSLGTPDARVWTSVEGITWSRVPGDGGVFGVAEMTGVASGGPGVVAVGATKPWDDLDAAVWVAATDD